jgi:ABC-2 type transport system permease protein
MKAIFDREFKAYFNTASGFIFMVVFLLISGIFFVLTNLFTGDPYYNPVLQSTTFIFLILVPMITMKTLAEERHQKTDQLLLTSPVSLSEIVLGKYFAAVGLFLVTLLITCIYPVILGIFGAIAVWEILGSYIGFALLGAAFISIGMFVSSLTENQVASAVGTFGALLLIWIIDWIQQGLLATQTAGFAAKFLGWFSLTKRYESFTMGILDIGTIIYYITFSAAFLFLTIRVMDKRRWS